MIFYLENFSIFQKCNLYYLYYFQEKCTESSVVESKLMRFYYEYLKIQNLKWRKSHLEDFTPLDGSAFL